ncbi:MAG: acetylxylan esterase, partial [Phycisphaerae bacterium]|nr:acetylxylan esterase [Phycisphaerae bacterium]
TPAERRQAQGMLGRFVGNIESEARQARDRQLASLATPDHWRARQQQIRKRLPGIFGDFAPKCPLEPRIVGKLDRPDYVIEKLIFESQPGYHVTANVYVPKRRAFPRPAVLFTCGHAADGKAYHLYHDACLGFVLKGYVVLALDPTGQGERSEYFDPKTGRPTVPLCVPHHHYLARPSWLVGRTLAGCRTWDCIRALDYLAARPEIDPDRIAAVGNSGGGIMALLITAVDERIKVCAAAHPGGSMEQTFLTGRWLTECDVLGLIAPRPCLIIVGRDSGEETGHRNKLIEMHRFYAGLGADKDRAQLALVDGVHNMEKPKREPAYAWVNKWFDQKGENATEPPLKTETVEDLRCSKTGLIIRDLNGQSGWTLNARLADKLRPPRDVPQDVASLETERAKLKRTIARRIGLKLPPSRTAPKCTTRGRFDADDLSAEKLVIESAPGIELPALLLTSKTARGASRVVLHVAEAGKPTTDSAPSIALALARKGLTVLSVDVRGAGETDPRDRSGLKPLISGYDPAQFRVDACAVDCALADTTVLAGQAYDVIRSLDYLAARKDMTNRPIMLVGEGLGGVWALTAAAFDDRPAAVVCAGTTPSYKLIVGSQYYKTRDYFWVPGALRDFDLPDLVALIAPRPVTLIDPVDAMLDPLPADKASNLLTWPRQLFEKLGRPTALRIAQTRNREAEEIAHLITP